MAKQQNPKKPNPKNKKWDKGRGERRVGTKQRDSFKRGSSSKDERRDAEIAGTADAEIRSSETNAFDPWYNKYPDYINDVALLSFGTPVGQPVYLNGNDYVANAGIMTLSFIPSPGYSADLNSPVNRQALRIYSYLRSVLRSANAYDAADLMMYLLAIDSMYTYWAYLRRAYGVAQLFSPTNKYYPRRLLQAMGVDPNIVNNLADFRAYINRFALNIGRYACPKDFELFARHQWMTSGLYLDSNTGRAQTYMFSPAVLYQFDNTVTTGSKLVGQQFGSFAATPLSRDLNSLQTFGNNLINMMENDTDTMNISGDIYRAYGPEGCFSVENTPDGYMILPVYDETVLSQIENAVLMGVPINSAGVMTMPEITQNPSVNNGAILFQPTFNGGAFKVHDTTYVYNYPAVNNMHLMNFHWDKPSAEQVTEATRMIAGCRNHPTWTTTALLPLNPELVPSDIISYMDICVTSLTNPAGVQFLHMNTQTCVQNTSGVVLNTLSADMLALGQQFDWAPMIYVVTLDEAGDKLELRLMAADVDVFSGVTFDQLINVNEGVFLSLLDVPKPTQI